MSHHELVLLHQLSRHLVSLYCGHHVHLAQMSKLFMRDNLLLVIANYLKIDYDRLPGEQVFYRAMRQDDCGSGTLETLAVLYYIKVEPEKEEEHKAYLMRILGRKQVSATPYWNRFVEEQKQRKARSDLGDLPKAVEKQVKGLTPEEMKSLLEWLKRELGK